MSGISQTVVVWAEMVKLPHSIFALPFALTAAFLAGRHLPGRHWPFLGQIGLVVVCMVAARSVAMTFNRLVDCEIDARNPRTAGRPLPMGRLTRAAAFAMLGLSALTFGVGCLGFAIFYGNSWPMLFSGPVLLVLCGYSYCKRFTQWSHVVLGSAIAMSPAASWLAIHPPSMGWPAVLLAASVAFWIAGFDIIYSCQDIDIDRRDGLFSLPARLGPATALWIARGFHVLTVAALWGVGRLSGMQAPYYAGVALVALLLAVENMLVHPGDYRRVNVAFFTVNGMVSLVWAAAAILDLFWV